MDDDVNSKRDPLVWVFHVPNRSNMLKHSGPVGIGTHHPYRGLMMPVIRNVIDHEGAQARAPNQHAFASQFAERLTYR
jgi:hypothetical protein